MRGVARGLLEEGQARLRHPSSRKSVRINVHRGAEADLRLVAVRAFEPPVAWHHFALLAQLVEHIHGKDGVDGSSPSEGFPRGIGSLEIKVRRRRRAISINREECQTIPQGGHQVSTSTGGSSGCESPG